MILTAVAITVFLTDKAHEDVK